MTCSLNCGKFLQPAPPTSTSVVWPLRNEWLSGGTADSAVAQVRRRFRSRRRRARGCRSGPGRRRGRWRRRRARGGAGSMFAATRAILPPETAHVHDRVDAVRGVDDVTAPDEKIELLVLRAQHCRGGRAASRRAATRPRNGRWAMLCLSSRGFRLQPEGCVKRSHRLATATAFRLKPEATIGNLSEEELQHELHRPCRADRARDQCRTCSAR